jgi:deoxycytidine triphosphate deaminase/intein/homing endonuclease
VILSDRTIREELEAGRIVIEPLGEGCIQPSSVDLHVDRFFRVFRNHTMGFIDVKQDLEELTEMVEIKEDDVFILHPGEFVLGSTLERVALPNDLVARLEGKSSLGRLGLLIHSSLPGSEPVVVRVGGEVLSLPIEEVVRKQITGEVIGFDPDTFEVGYFPITGWFEGPPDRIFEVRLASGRSVRVTAGHNLFTLDRNGEIRKVRTAEVAAGARVAIPSRLPSAASSAPVLLPCDLAPAVEHGWLVVEGPTVRAAFDEVDLAPLLVDAGYRHHDFYRRNGMLPLPVARLVPGLVGALGPDDRVRGKGAKNGVPAAISLDEGLAWLLGIYVAEGYRRPGQVVISNTDETVLDRAEAELARLGLPVYRRSGTAVTCSSTILSALLGWLGTGGGAHTKRLPAGFLGWSDDLLLALVEGLFDGDGSREDARDSYWSCSPGLVDDVLLLAERLGRRAAAYRRTRGGSQLFQVAFPNREHKLLRSVPLPDSLLIRIREELGLTQVAASVAAGFKNPTDLNNIERRRGRDALRRDTLQRLRSAYATAGSAPSQGSLDRLVDGDLAWDTVLEVRDTGRVETIFDIEVRPNGRKIENFLAGSGGVLVSNTAGFVDAGFNGHLTLELSNVANLPITLYPGMKIGQISFLKMTTDADHPYGSAEMGSKYQGQRGPTPSRYFENFRK